MKTTRKIPVSRRALLARISRRHAREGEVVRKNRNRGYRGDEPDYYVISSQNYVIGGFDESTIESYARELEVLSDFERLAPE